VLLFALVLRTLGGIIKAQRRQLSFSVKDEHENIECRLRKLSPL
jgi:hypothetical protein